MANFNGAVPPPPPPPPPPGGRVPPVPDAAVPPPPPAAMPRQPLAGSVPPAIPGAAVPPPIPGAPTSSSGYAAPLVGSVPPPIPGAAPPPPPAAPHAPPVAPVSSVPMQGGLTVSSPAPGSSPWAPAAPPPPLISPPPMVAPPVAAPVVPAAIVEDLDDDDESERTVIASKHSKRLTAVLHLPDGSIERLDAPVVVLGRRPDAPADSPDAKRISVTDATKTVSKTHAVLSKRGSEWVIADLNSTNGVFVVSTDGTETPVPPGTEALLSERFFLGDAELRFFLDS